MKNHKNLVLASDELSCFLANGAKLACICDLGFKTRTHKSLDCCIKALCNFSLLAYLIILELAIMNPSG